MKPSAIALYTDSFKCYRPILDLPPANTEVVYCELSEAEKDFYEALFRRSKVQPLV